MKKYLTTAETAKLIRSHLKQYYPEVKFSVRSDNYAGGSSIRVTYDSDVIGSFALKQELAIFEGATFDGSIDLKEYKGAMFCEEDGTQVYSGTDFVFVSNDNYEFERAIREARSRAVA